MNSEGLQRWIDAQIIAWNPDTFLAQILLLVGVILTALLLAAAMRQVARLLPVGRNQPQVKLAPEAQKAAVEKAQPRLTIEHSAALKSTAAAGAAYRSVAASGDLSSRQKKKYTKARPKKYYSNIEKAPSDPMFLPPYDTNVPYRDRLAMIGSGKGT